MWKCRLAFTSLWEFYCLGDFSQEREHVVLNDFCSFYSLTSLINKSAYIDLISINCLKYFQNFNIIEAVLFDFHKIRMSKIKTILRKLNPKIICCRKYKHFSNDIFKDTILKELSQVRISNKENSSNIFLKIFRNNVDKLAPRRNIISGVTTLHSWVKISVRRLWKCQNREKNI